MKKCPNCTGLMPNDVTRCIRCGFDARPTDTPLADPLVAPNERVERQGRFATGWMLATRSCRVLMLDKSLVVFPMLSGLASFFVLASYLGGLFAFSHPGNKHVVNDSTAWVLTFIYYFASYFVIVYFNSALVACAMVRFRGGTPTLAAGLRAAGERLGQIVAWAFFAATVGLILRMIEERVGFIGKIVVGLVGAAWTVATYFVVPVLVEEDVGPFDALKHSTEIIKETWGESLVSNVGIGLVATLVTVLAVAPVGALTYLVAVKTGSVAVAIAGGLAVLLILVASALVSSALSSIVLSASYLYATAGKVPRVFADAGLQYAFAPKE